MKMEPIIELVLLLKIRKGVNYDDRIRNLRVKANQDTRTNYDSVELKATVSSSSFSVEFFITISGKKMQCFEMIDKGMFTEKNFNIISKAIANHFRGLPNFNTDSINKYTITLK